MERASGASEGRATSTSITVSIATLLKTMIGAGIFSLPVGLLRATPVPGLGILTCVGILSAGSYWMVGYCCLVWGVGTFRDLWNCCFTKGTAWIIDASIFLNGWLTMVCYIVLIGDFTTKSFAGWLGEGHFLARGRAVHQLIIAMSILLPLSMKRDLSGLAFTSMLGLSVVVYVIFLVLHDSWWNSPDSWSPGMAMFEWRMGAFEACALYTHAFVAHFNAPKLLSELERPTQMRWLRVVLCAYLMAFFIYASFALAGLRRFEADVQGNILKNYGAHPQVLLAWLGMGFAIAFTYPIVFNSVREAAVNIFHAMELQVPAHPSMRSFMSSPRFHGSSTRLRHRTISQASILGPSPETDGQRLAHKPGRKATVLLVLLTAFNALLCEDLGVMNALAGSLMGVNVCLVMPGLLFLFTARKKLQPARQGSEMERPLLTKKGIAASAKRGAGMYWFAQFAGGATACAGVCLMIIGTSVILAEHA